MPPTSKYSPMDTKSLPPNIMDLRDEAFYEFVRQFFGTRVAELLAFQECNGVDSLLGCKDVTAVLQLKSDQLNDLKKNTCITLTDGSVAVLPGLESSTSNLIKLLKKKREEMNKQAQRLQSITSALPASSTISSVLPTTTISISHPSTDTPSSSNMSIPVNSSNSPSLSAIPDPLTNDISNRISETVSNWLKKNQQELHLINISFQHGIDFHVELNKRRDGVIMRCKCGMKNAVSQKRGVLVFSNIYRHFKSNKCSLITGKKRPAVVDYSANGDEENDSHSNLMMTTRSTSPTPRQSKSNSIISTSSIINNRSRSRSVSNVSKEKKQRLN